MGDERRTWAWEQNGRKRVSSRENKQNTSSAVAKTSSAFTSVNDGKGTTQSAINPATPPHARDFHHDKGRKGQTSSVDLARSKPRRNHASYLEVTRSPSYMRGPGGGMLRSSTSPAVDDFSWTAASSPVVTMKSPPAPVRTGRPAKSVHERSGGGLKIRRGSGGGGGGGGPGGVETPGRSRFLPPPAIQRQKGFWDSVARPGVMMAPSTPFPARERSNSFEASEAGGGDGLGTPDVKSSVARAASSTPGISSPSAPRHGGSRGGDGDGYVSVSVGTSTECTFCVGARAAGGEFEVFDMNGGGGNTLEGRMGTTGGINGCSGCSSVEGRGGCCRPSCPRRQRRVRHHGREENGGGNSSSSGSATGADEDGVDGDGRRTIGRGEVGASGILLTGADIGGCRSTVRRERGQRKRSDDSSAERFSGNTDLDDREWQVGKDGEPGRRDRASRRRRRGSKRSSGEKHEESLADFNRRMAVLASATRLCLATTASTTASVMETPPHPIPAVTTPVVPRRRQAKKKAAAKAAKAAKAMAESPDDVASNRNHARFNCCGSNGSHNANSNIDDSMSKSKSNSGGDCNASLWFWSTPARGVKDLSGTYASPTLTISTPNASLPSERTRPKTRPWPDFESCRYEPPTSEVIVTTPLRKSTNSRAPHGSALHALSAVLETAAAAAPDPECSSLLDLSEERGRSIKQRYRERLEHFRLIQEARQASSTRGLAMLRGVLEESRAFEQRALRLARLKEKVLNRVLGVRRRAFLAWAHLARTSSRQRARQLQLQLLTRSSSLRLQRTLRQTFSAWREETRRSKRTRETLRCLTGTKRQLVLARWKVSARQSAAARRMALDRLRDSKKACFSAWRDAAKESTRSRELAVRKREQPARGAPASLATARGFLARWKAWAEEQAAAKRMARRLEKDELLKCFRALAGNQLNVRARLEARRLDTLRAIFGGWRAGLGRILRAGLLQLPPTACEDESAIARCTRTIGGRAGTGSCNDVEQKEKAAASDAAATVSVSKDEVDIVVVVEEGQDEDDFSKSSTTVTLPPSAFFAPSPDPGESR